tara:strand:- start:327 stop:1202 length:876 start_codon:yes stop_codon:yes gene_type:complete
MPKRYNRKRRDPKDVQKEVDGLIQQIDQGIAALTSSEDWATWLKWQGAFTDYSAGNTMLIAMQCPHATRVAGVKAWNALGRKVIKGSKSIRILAPKTYKTTEQDSSGNDVETYRCAGFRSIGVFDFSQTEGEELPARPYQIGIEGEEDNGLFDDLKAFSIGNDCPVEIEDIEGAALGYYQPFLHRIAINAGMPRARMAHTLAHEVAHSLMHRSDGTADGRNPLHLTRGIKELEAESVAYIVCNAAGIDPGDCSFGYIADWNGKKTRDELKDSTARIKSTARDIIKALKPTK